MNLIWTRSARFDLRQIQDFYFRRNPVAALELIDDIVSAAMKLEGFPELGRAADSSKVRLWQVPGRPYLLPYRIVGNDIEILAVFDERQKRPDDWL
jgi:toxin ParE1/3/4